MREVVVLDVETQDWDGGSRGVWRAPRLAVAVALHVPSSTYRAYFEGQVAQLLELLRAAELVVGFAVRSFDYLVLERYAGPWVHGLPTLDVLEEVYRSARRRVGLHRLALATLGRGKSADGWQALRWWRRGQLDRVVEYCRRDVELTWQLYEFGRRTGRLLYADRQGQVHEVEVDWSALPHRESTDTRQAGGVRGQRPAAVEGHGRDPRSEASPDPVSAPRGP